MNKKPNAYALSKRTAIVDIFPTIATFLNIKLSKSIADAIEGVSLLDPKF
jgi:hypothetical protein